MIFKPVLLSTATETKNSQIILKILLDNVGVILKNRDRKLNGLSSEKLNHSDR